MLVYMVHLEKYLVHSKLNKMLAMSVNSGRE